MVNWYVHKSTKISSVGERAVSSTDGGKLVMHMKKMKVDPYF